MLIFSHYPCIAGSRTSWPTYIAGKISVAAERRVIVVLLHVAFCSFTLKVMDTYTHKIKYIPTNGAYFPLVLEVVNLPSGRFS